MEITIKGEPKEIAALALELQERRLMKDVVSDVMCLLQAAQNQNEPIFQRK